MGQNDGLYDNLLLEKAKLIADEQGRGRRLEVLYRQYQNTDGGAQALYELTRLTIELYRRETKKENLTGQGYAGEFPEPVPGEPLCRPGEKEPGGSAGV
jgi:hypothetical protein